MTPDDDDTTAAMLLGRTSSDYLLVRPISRAYPGAIDESDGNWLNVAIELRARAFRGEYSALLRAEEIAAFRDELRRLYERLSGEARLDSMEGWLEVVVVGDGLGHFNARCEACDEPGGEARLNFTLAFDQTDLPPVLARLDRFVAQYPVIGPASEG